MTFFRFALCVAGFLSYLIIRQFTAPDTVRPAGQDVLKVVPTVTLDVTSGPPFAVEAPPIRPAALLPAVAEARSDARIR